MSLLWGCGRAGLGDAGLMAAAEGDEFFKVWFKLGKKANVRIAHI
jgi:hypothetical protein